MSKIKKNTSKGMRIIIVGGGKVGSTLVEQLSAEGHDITLIDKNADRVNYLSGVYDVMGLVGNGATYSVQKEAGIEEADLFIAVTAADELNLLCCTVAKRVGHCVTIARVHTPEYSKDAAYLRDKLGLEMIINPEMESAKVISRILYLPTAEEVSSFAHGQVEMVKISIPQGNMLDGKRIMDIGTADDYHVVICAVERDGDVHIPSGLFVLHAGDKISFVASRNETTNFLRKIGLSTGQVRDVIIIGGSKSAYYLSKILIPMGIEVRIIEMNHKKCEELSQLLPRAIIMNADGSNEEILKEAGLFDAQAVIPLTGMDEENILLNMYVRQQTEAKAITVMSRNNFKGIVEKSDVGSVLYPKYIASEAIIAYVRAKQNSMDSNIETLYQMFDSRAEAIEFIVEKESDVTGLSLSQLKLKDNLLIAFINRHGRLIFPTGSDHIEVGDSVMIVTKHRGIGDLQEILR